MHVVCALHRQPAISLHAAQPRAGNMRAMCAIYFSLTANKAGDAASG